MDKTGILGQALGQLGDVAKKTGESIVKVPVDLAEAAAEQAGVKSDPTKTASNSQTNTTPNDNQNIQDTKDVVKSLYGKSDDTKKTASNVPQQSQQSELQKQIADKSPEEQKKILELQQKLHRETYYDPTFNPVKKQEERPAEKVENEKKKEMQDLQQKEQEKPPPLAVQRAQRKTEMLPGTSG